jgi:hypothetical protein
MINKARTLSARCKSLEARSFLIIILYIFIIEALSVNTTAVQPESTRLTVLIKI